MLGEYGEDVFTELQFPSQLAHNLLLLLPEPLSAANSLSDGSLAPCLNPQHGGTWTTLSLGRTL